MLNKPIYIGGCVLDSSKLLMFKFHYDVFKLAFPRSIMMKTDTDSLCYYIETEDLYQDLKTNSSIQQFMEFSNYPKDHYLYNNDRKKVPGLFQDECVDPYCYEDKEKNPLWGKMSIISEYVGLRAKSYCNKLVFLNDSFINKEKKKSKGVPRRHIEKRINFQNYKECLFDKKIIKLDDIYSFRSLQLSTYSITQSKIALSYCDDKRHILDDGITTLAHGHYKIKK